MGGFILPYKKEINMKNSLDVSHKNAVTNLHILTLANYSMDLHKFHIYPRLNYAGLQILWNIKTVY